MNFRSWVLQGLDLQAYVATLFAICGRLLLRAALCRKSSRLSLLPFILQFCSNPGTERLASGFRVLSGTALSA